jgi:hypothetical protein
MGFSCDTSSSFFHSFLSPQISILFFITSIFFSSLYFTFIYFTITISFFLINQYHLLLNFFNIS